MLIVRMLTEKSFVSGKHVGELQVNSRGISLKVSP